MIEKLNSRFNHQWEKLVIQTLNSYFCYIYRSRYIDQCQQLRQSFPLKLVWVFTTDLKTLNHHHFSQRVSCKGEIFEPYTTEVPCSASDGWHWPTVCAGWPWGSLAMMGGLLGWFGWEGFYRPVSKKVSRCHSWGLTNTIRMKSVTFGKLITLSSGQWMECTNWNPYTVSTIIFSSYFQSVLMNKIKCSSLHLKSCNHVKKLLDYVSFLRLKFHFLVTFNFETFPKDRLT